MNLGFVEIIGILMLVILLFGAKRLPELGSGMGTAISNFKKSFKDSQTIDVTPKADTKNDDVEKPVA